MKLLAQRLELDRWTLSYTQHTATALRRRVLAASNGHK